MACSRSRRNHRGPRPLARRAGARGRTHRGIVGAHSEPSNDGRHNACSREIRTVCSDPSGGPPRRRWPWPMSRAASAPPRASSRVPAAGQCEQIGSGRTAIRPRGSEPEFAPPRPPRPHACPTMDAPRNGCCRRVASNRVTPCAAGCGSGTPTRVTVRGVGGAPAPSGRRPGRWLPLTRSAALSSVGQPCGLAGWHGWRGGGRCVGA